MVGDGPKFLAGMPCNLFYRWNPTGTHFKALPHELIIQFPYDFPGSLEIHLTFQVGGGKAEHRFEENHEGNPGRS